jgi:hypothetical protein
VSLLRRLGFASIPGTTVLDATGRTLATGEVSAPEHGGAILMEGALWVCTYRRPTGGAPANQS